MDNFVKTSAVAAALLIGLSACASNTGSATIIRDGGSQYSSSNETSLESSRGLDYRDFERAANRAVESFLANDLSQKPGGGRWVLMISRVINDTSLNIDTNQLVKKIRVALLNSGRVMVTTAVGADGPEDAASRQVRELQNDEMFNQKTVQGNGTLVAPDMSLSGRIIRRASDVGNKQILENYFQLSITNLATGLAYWEYEDVIAKQTGNRDYAW